MLGALTDLGTLGGSTSEGFAIIASGQIAGQANLVGDTQFHAVLSNGAHLLDLGTLGGPTSSAPLPLITPGSLSASPTCLTAPVLSLYSM